MNRNKYPEITQEADEWLKNEMKRPIQRDFVDDLELLIKRHITQSDPFTMIATCASAAGMIGAACDAAMHSIRPIIREASEDGFNMFRQEIKEIKK